MSCTLNQISRINDVNFIFNLLRDAAEDQQIIDKGFGDDFDVENWSDDWDSAEECNSIVELNAPHETAKRSCFQSSNISLSPSEELLIITENDNCIVLTKKWPNNQIESSVPYYEVLWNGGLSQDPNDHVTKITCIPLASQQRSSGGSPDWTCLVAGFSSGYIRIFMPNGKQLLAQYLHDEPVVNIKLKSRLPHRQPGETGQQVEELIILYPNAVVTIDGFSLYQSLRACRSQLAKAQASNSNCEMVVEPPPLEYHKWRVDTQKKVSDIASCGTKTLCLFDRLQAASVLDGPRGVVKGSAPAFTSLLSVGKDPFLAVFHATEGVNQPILSDVALAVAAKFTTAMFSRLTAARGWFGGNQNHDKSPSKDAKPKIERGIHLNSIVCLPDSIRHADSIKVAPMARLAVVTDSFNRVLLVDTNKGIVIRMWKGYRDAECGWVVVDEEADEDSQSKHVYSTKKRRALFLVIYAPKRGVLEIYLMEHGSRVGAFYVGKDCRLLYSGYRALGQLQTEVENYTNDVNQCYLLQSDGILKSIHVPFHLALSTTHSVQAKDAHLLKRISNLIESSANSELNKDLCELLSHLIFDIQVPASQRKAVELILSTSHFSAFFLQLAINRILIYLKEEKKNNNDEDLQYRSEREELIIFCQAQHRLIELYITIEDLIVSKESSDSELDISDGKDKAIAKLLHLTSSEAQTFINSLDRYKETCLEEHLSVLLNTPQNTMSKHLEHFDICRFLSCFSVEVRESNAKSELLACASTSSRHLTVVNLRETLSEETISVLGKFLFQDALHGRVATSKLTLTLETSQLPPQQVMMLLTLYTQSKNSSAILDLATLYQLASLVSSICSIKGGYETESFVSVGQISTWWHPTREILRKSIMVGASYVMAFVCRSVSIELAATAHKIQKSDEGDISSFGWECVTMDMQEWNVLVNQLENLLELDKFVHTNHALVILSGIESPSFDQHKHAEHKVSFFKNGKITKFQKSKITHEIPPLSVKGVLKAGIGAFAQIVADCLVRQGVPGPCLGTARTTTGNRNGTTMSSAPERTYDDDDVPEEEGSKSVDTLAALLELRKYFPFGLEEDLLWIHCAWGCIMVWNEDFEDVDMLASALIHLSCVHNPTLKEGLAVLMWKAVYKDSIKELTALIDKVGKAPKDRLCKKTVSLSYKALQEFLGSAKQLLELILENDFENDTKPEFKTEDIWQRPELAQRSIAEQAVEEHCCNRELVNHQLCHVTTLYMIMLSGAKNVKPSMLLDSKGRHALMHHLHATPLLSKELDDAIMKNREKFCLDVGKAFVDHHLNTTSEEEMTRNRTSELVYNCNMIFELSKRFQLNEDYIRRHISCGMYSSGLDLAAQEMSMLIQDKALFNSQMLEVIRKRLALFLLNGNAEQVSNSLSKLPTKITSWVQAVDLSTIRLPIIPLVETYRLLQYLRTNAYRETKEYVFINELIEGLRHFVS